MSTKGRDFWALPSRFPKTDIRCGTECREIGLDPNHRCAAEVGPARTGER